MLNLVKVTKSNPILVKHMENNYTQPRGFVGRSIAYLVFYNNDCYGSIVAGSAIMHLKGRDKFFNLNKENKITTIQCIINNVFFHIEPINSVYPIRNFAAKVLRL